MIVNAEVRRTLRLSLPGLTVALWLISGTTLRWDVEAAEAVRRFALLVGVSDYAVTGVSNLEGARNDVLLMRDLLRREFPDTDIRILAERVEHAERPTADAIRRALGDLRQSVESGDLVLFYLSGHGMEQPARPGNGEDGETDGLERVFAAADYAGWDEETHSLTNVLTKRDFDREISGMRERGAKIWVIVDACHSGAMLRAQLGDASQHYRYVDVRSLLSPSQRADYDRTFEQARQKAKPLRTRAAVVSRPGIDLTLSKAVVRGDLVAFYAAQGNQATPELPLPAGSAQQDLHGLFTFALAQALNDHPGLSYRQAEQAIEDTYWMMGHNSSDPIFEGTNLDAPVFGAARSARRWEWAVRPREGRLVIDAGSLHQLAPGMVLPILRAPGASEVVGDARLDVVRPFESELSVMAPDGSRHDQTVPGGAVVHLPRMRLLKSLKLARQPVRQPNAKRVFGMLKDVRHRAAGEFDLVLAPSNREADLRLWVDDNTLYILGSSAISAREGRERLATFDLSDGDEALATALCTRLSQLVRQKTVLDLVGRIDDAGADGEIEARVTVQRKARGETAEVLGGGHVGVADGDVVTITVRNASQESRDVDILYLSRDGRTALVYPDAGRSARVEKGDRVVRHASLTPATGAAGPLPLGTIAVITSTSAKFGPAMDLEYLLGPPPCTRRVGENPGESLVRGSRVTTKDVFTLAYEPVGSDPLHLDTQR